MLPSKAELESISLIASDLNKQWVTTADGMHHEYGGLLRKARVCLYLRLLGRSL